MFRNLDGRRCVRHGRRRQVPYTLVHDLQLGKQLGKDDPKGEDKGTKHVDVHKRQVWDDGQPIGNCKFESCRAHTGFEKAALSVKEAIGEGTQDSI
jgi:hypothetical protein